MDISNVQLSGRYAFNERWFGQVKLPFGSHDQSAKIIPQKDEAGNLPTEEEVDAMIRNGIVHHRTEAYTGARDFEFSLGRQITEPFSEGDLLLWSAGLTVPLGSTEDDPWKRGREGLEHTHIQLGNGTVDPIVDLTYVCPLSSRWGFIGTASGRFPLYENSKTYRGSIHGIASGRMTFSATDRWSFDGAYQLDVQGYAHWDGARDDNTGVLSHTLEGGVSGMFGATRVRLGGLLPVATQLFLDDSDGFEPGATVTLSLTRSGG